jgi:type 2 lantibiotic biosynthesis protein LanM
VKGAVLDERTLRRLAARAASLKERLERGAPAVRSTPSGPAAVGEAEERVRRWRVVLGQTAGDGLARRLVWDGRTVEDARSALSDPGEWHGPLPGWAGVLRDIVAGAFPSPIPPVIGPVPFAEVYWPVVVVAADLLRTRLGSRDRLIGRLAEGAHLGLQERLLERLSSVAIRVLLAEFEARRAGHAAKGTAPDECYRAFVAELLEDGLLSLFCRYPVLGRLVATTVGDWVESAVELCERLDADLPEIVRTFGVRSGNVVFLEKERSDPHEHGRSVVTLVFEDGRKLLHKFRGLETESALTELWRWCRARGGLSLDLESATVLSCGTYGWQEFVEGAPCGDREAVSRYYGRAGMLAGLLHALRATDFHTENLVARGEHPIVVDAETLLQHDAEPPSPGPRAMRDRFRLSVRRTDLLPHWSLDDETGALWEAGGLANPLGVPPSEAQPRWRDVNTDSMRMEFEEVPWSWPILPSWEGIPRGPAAFRGELRSGFEEMYRFLMRHAAELTVPNGPLARLRDLQVRFVARPTGLYKRLLRESLEPDRLRDGAERSLCFEALAADLVASPSCPHEWPLVVSEIEALERLDVPRFLAAADGRSLLDASGVVVGDCFRTSALADARAVIASLDENDLAWQTALLDGAVLASGATVLVGEDEREEPSEGRAGGTAAATALVRTAEEIAARLRQVACVDPDGTVQWIGFTFIPAAERFQHLPLGDDLLDGRCGVALFLATLDELRNKKEYRDLALGALAPLRQVAEGASDGERSAWARGQLVGGLKGLGSLVYGLVRIGRLLGEPSLLEDARVLARLLTRGAFAADRAGDVVTGAAGALLALLALHAETGESDVLERARLAGVRVEELAKAKGAPAPVGFGRGPSGMAAALVRLAAATGEFPQVETARTLFARERAAMEEAGRPRNGWCHGTAGMGLGRLDAMGLLDEPAGRHTVETALGSRWPRTDSLCCGVPGRLELELVAARRLSRPDLADGLGGRASSWLAGWRARGGPDLLSGVPRECFLPSLFHGASGVGYQLLRIARPDSVPSLLLMEAGGGGRIAPPGVPAA